MALTKEAEASFIPLKHTSAEAELVHGRVCGAAVA
jgi:hypothetical protein